jgi:hypothetical protein
LTQPLQIFDRHVMPESRALASVIEIVRSKLHCDMHWRVSKGLSALCHLDHILQKRVRSGLYLQVDVRGKLEGMAGLIASKASLKHLHITNCHSYAACPMVLGELTALTHLHISGPQLLSGVFQLG